MYIDTHCHLTFPDFTHDLAEVLARTTKAGVTQCIVPGVDGLSSQLAMDLANKHPGMLFASIGFHPYEASHETNVAFIEKTISGRPAIKPIVAIGEIGLDYHLFKGEDASGKKQQQRVLFEEQLRIALRFDLPVIMHCRDAFGDFFDVLDSLPVMPRGVIHCFSGGLQELRMAQERGLMVGIDGNVTYSKQLSRTVQQIPLSMLLLETDSPYLTPVPHRGSRNEPTFIPLISREIATLQSTTAEIVAGETTVNAKRLFNLP